MSAPARIWVTGTPSVNLQGNIVGLHLDRVQEMVAVPQVTLDAFAELSASLTSLGERLATEARRISEGVHALYRSLPRAVRRARSARVTRDKLSPHWPGTDAVTPDHPARVLYKRAARQALVSPTEDAQQRIDRALDRCVTAEERAASCDLADMTRVPVIMPAGIENLDTDSHRTPVPDSDRPPLLQAVRSSRNAPTDAHALCAYLSHIARPLRRT